MRYKLFLMQKSNIAYQSICSLPLGDIDIKTLDTEQKFNIASQVCYFFLNGYLYNEEEQFKKYLKQLASDSNRKLRIYIANQLQNAPSLPHAIAWKLALDINKAAIPIIRYSPILTEKDLVTIIQTIKEPQKLAALANRSNLTEKVCAAIIAAKNLNLIIEILKNPSSNISFELYQILLNSYYNSQLFLDALLLRNSLDNKVLQKLVTELDEEAKQAIIRHFNLNIYNGTSSFCPTNIISFENESFHEKKEELRRKIDQLYSQNNLNHAVVVHFFCKGDLYSFLYSMAKLSGSPFNQVKYIILNHINSAQFENLYNNSGIPYSLKEPIKTIIEILINKLKEGETISSKNFSSYIKNHILNNNLHQRIEGMSYLIKLI